MGILNVAFRQGTMLKRFKVSDIFGKMITELGVSRPTVYFKINLLNILEKYPKLKKSSSTLNFLKNYFKTIKEVFKESGTEFK